MRESSLPMTRCVKTDEENLACSWSAIVRGAVHDGLAYHVSGESWEGGNGILQSRCARFSYGTPVTAPFRVGVHPLENMYRHPQKGTFYCKGMVDWFITKVMSTMFLRRYKMPVC